MKDLFEYILENKGHDFEDEYFDNWQKYKKLLIDNIGLNLPKNCELENIGKRNTKRPLIFSDNKIEITNGNSEASGNDIADYRVVSTDDKSFSLNLSLKYGKTVTYLNCGVTLCFNNDYTPTENGKKLLNFFGIDPIKFKFTFDNYQKLREKNNTVTVYKKGKDVDPDIITDSININDILDFLKQALGYGYILIHKIGKDIKHYDLRTFNDRDSFIGKTINSIDLIYPQGRGKFVKVLIELENKICSVIFRNKQGGIHPSSMLVTFKEK